MEMQYMVSLYGIWEVSLKKVLKPATMLAKVINLHDFNFFQTMPNKKLPVLKYACAQ